MMAMIEWDTFWLGLVTGALASALFFAGLAVGMRFALQRDNPAALLLISAAVRIALLLWSGSLIASRGTAAIVGFVLAFFIARLLVTALARPAKAREPAQWN